MIKKIALGLVFLLIFLSPSLVSAHLAGQPPFFKINGVYSNLYPVPTVSAPDFNLPQDLADKNYLVNQNLSFEIDSKFLPVPAEVINQTRFNWDFGDGQKGTGLKNNHTYTKPKSYILSITAQASTDPQATLIQSVMINILPNSNYKLPTSVIKVNDKKAQDPLTDILTADFSKILNFDGSTSRGGSGKIASIQWDFGDTNTASQLVVTHKYEDSLSQVFPVLRVIDEQGFVGDSFLEITNKPGQDSTTSQAGQTTTNTQNQLLIYILVFVGLIILAVVFKLLKSKKR